MKKLLSWLALSLSALVFVPTPASALLANVNTVQRGLSSNPANGVAFNGSLYFSANRFDVGVELFRTDGTDAGTGLVADLNPTGSSTPVPVEVLNNKLLIAPKIPSMNPVVA